MNLSSHAVILLLAILSLALIFTACGGEAADTGSSGKKISGPDIVPSHPDFERVTDKEGSGTSKIMNRSQLNPDKAYDSGDFLSRIWANFGKPEFVQFEGFWYFFKDKQTGLIFSAYSGASGPAYGGFPQDREKLEPVFRRFEELLQKSTPVECEIQFGTDYGTYRCGYKNGKSFSKRAQ